MKARMTAVSFMLATLASCLTVALFLPTDSLAATYNISSPGGGSCSAIGTWNAASSTCTLNRDIVIQASTGQDGIEATSNGVTIDGAGHTLSLQGTYVGQFGVLFHNRSGGTLKNIKITGFSVGIRLEDSSNIIVTGNQAHACGWGVYVNNVSVSNFFSYNTFSSNAQWGISLGAGSTGDFIYQNNFISNNHQAYDGGGPNTWAGNYWNDYDSPAEGCHNATFDMGCDAPYTSGAVTDTTPSIMRNGWARKDWTWYDNVGGTDWVLLGDRSNSAYSFVYNLRIAGAAQNPGNLSGGGPGYVTPGNTLYSLHPGIMNGPVNADVQFGGPGPVTSQRILWPQGGDSLEEVPGTDVATLDHRLFWTWYDMQSPGYKNWILISNPNDYQIYYSVLIGGIIRQAGTIPANGRVTPSFPGLMGGPVEVNGWNAWGESVRIMASQRVLTNDDMAFNEVTGQPENGLASDHVWPWYDMTGSTRNWVLIANPTKSGDPGAYNVYYEVWIAGIRVMYGGPIPPGGNVTPTFPGVMGGPVEVKTFSNSARTIAAKSIASQRSIWGPSFEEVSGDDAGSLIWTYDWTWYDQFSPGATNWVLVATRPGETETVTVQISFTDQVTGTPVTVSHDITTAEKRWTPTFDGRMGGPVHVLAYRQGDPGTGKPVIASQRVLWGEYFNEVWGQ